MIENIETAAHQIVKRGAAVIAAGQIFADALSQNIVRTVEIILVVAVFPDQAMAVADTRVKALRFVAQFGLQRFNQFVGLGRGDLVGAVVENDLVVVILAVVGQRDHVAAVGHLVGLHFDAHTDRLERRTALGIDLGVVGKDGKVCRVAFGHHALRHVGDRADKRLFCQRVHRGLARRAHGRFAAERLDGLVGHTVGDQNQIFHRTLLFYVRIGKTYHSYSVYYNIK